MRTRVREGKNVLDVMSCRDQCKGRWKFMLSFSFNKNFMFLHKRRISGARIMKQPSAGTLYNVASYVRYSYAPCILNILYGNLKVISFIQIIGIILEKFLRRRYISLESTVYSLWASLSLLSADSCIYSRQQNYSTTWDNSCQKTHAQCSFMK